MGARDKLRAFSPDGRSPKPKKPAKRPAKHINLRDIMLTSSNADAKEMKIEAEMVKFKPTMKLATEAGTASQKANCQNQTRTLANKFSGGEAGSCNSVSGLPIAYPEPEKTGRNCLQSQEKGNTPLLTTTYHYLSRLITTWHDKNLRKPTFSQSVRTKPDQLGQNETGNCAAA